MNAPSDHEPIGFFKDYWQQWLSGWNRFWFTPANPALVCLMRIMVGLMLLYTHLVWSFELNTFFSSDGVFGQAYRSGFGGGSPFFWSHFNWFDSKLWLWGSHLVSILVLLAFTVGLWTRATSILAFLIVVSYAHAASGALFGLDQINGFLTLYLAVAPCGIMYSVDSAIKGRRQGRAAGKNTGPPNSTEPSVNVSTSANLAMRLMQVHLCIVYLFAGLGKLQGTTWWDGTAIWGALASYEYQTFDMTFLVHMPWMINIITLVAVFWELSYAFLIWPRLTRPIYLALAAAVHLGIGFCMGMITFGVIMLIANMAFLCPDLIQEKMEWFRRTRHPASDPASSS